MGPAEYQADPFQALDDLARFWVSKGMAEGRIYLDFVQALNEAKARTAEVRDLSKMSMNSFDSVVEAIARAQYTKARDNAVEIYRDNDNPEYFDLNYPTWEGLEQYSRTAEKQRALDYIAPGLQLIIDAVNNR